MRGIIKALILGWIGKKIYDRVSADGDEPAKGEPAAKGELAKKAVPHAKRAPPKRTTRKPARRAA